MGTRYTRFVKKGKGCEVEAETLIERVKKMRALNCSPSDVGINNFVFKRLLSKGPDISSKFF